MSETARLEAFSDGVFAIAITLLIIEIKVPSHEAAEHAGGLLRALIHVWPSFVGYVISFVTLGIMWINHHALCSYIGRVDCYFLFIHVLFLMCIAFLPFPTAVLAEYLPHPEERRAAVASYSATLVVIALAYNAVWWSAAINRRLLKPGCDADAVRTISRRYMVGPAAYGVSLALAFVSVVASLSVHAALAAFFLLPERKGR